MAERLADKIERLIAAAERAHAERLALHEQVEALTNENRDLRRVIEHSHARVEELAGQLRRLEDEAAETQRED
ncbi:MAG: hypothetical protein JXJ30_02405 [Halothiobacillaceae bacterium]|nr:hypothetical protein [Halothiobacillaceae bacterium]HER35371.1 hypothetical protein [Halothiobacillaceae bacterium]